MKRRTLSMFSLLTALLCTAMAGCAADSDSDDLGDENPAEASQAIGGARRPVLAANDTNTWIVRPNGKVWAAGDNTYGQLGNGQVGTSDELNPVELSGISNAVAVAAGSFHA